MCGDGCAGGYAQAGVPRARGGWRGELAGLPEGEHCRQLVDDASQGGQNQDVQNRCHPARGGAMGDLGTDRGAEAGDVLGQWRGGIF